MGAAECDRYLGTMHTCFLCWPQAALECFDYKHQVFLQNQSVTSPQKSQLLSEPRQLQVLNCLLVRLQVQGQVSFLVKLALPDIPKCAAGVKTELYKEAGENKA